MKPSELATLLPTLLRANKNVCLVGAPGIGKTSLVRQAAALLGWRVLFSHAVTSQPIDYKGMPAVTTRDGLPSAEFLPFGDLWALINATEPLIYFLDDIGQAALNTQAALMQLILGRTVNGYRISDHVRFIAATNGREHQAGSNGLITPLLDRFSVVLPVTFDLDEWIQFGLSVGTPPVLLAYARFEPDEVNRFEATRDLRKQPTARSVIELGDLLTLDITDTRVWAGCVGEVFATKFSAFYKVWLALPDRNEIYMNPTGAPVPDLKRPDVCYALMGSLAHGATTNNLEATTKYLKRVPKEFAVLCMKEATMLTPVLKAVPAFTQFTLDHKDVLFG
jgi:hypothetical protein